MAIFGDFWRFFFFNYFLPSSKVRRDPRLSLQGTDLQIRSAEVSDAGEYVCEVETDEDLPIAIVHSVEILGEGIQSCQMSLLAHP